MATNGNAAAAAAAAAAAVATDAGWPPGIPVPPAAGVPGVDAHHDIARDIGQQVEMMILEAKHQSESKVGKELQKIKAKMESMGEKIKVISERVARLEPAAHMVMKADLQSNITKLEEMWEGEVGTLKHELWQTIQAHNHNADLLKHQKDAIDQIQGTMADAAPNPELELVHAQLLQVDKMMQLEHSKEQQMDQLMQRLRLLQQHLGTPGAVGHGGVPPVACAAGYPAAATGAPPGVGVGPASAVAGPAAAAQAAANKRTQRTKAPKSAKPAAKSAQGANQLGGPTLRAEAPEFVPTTGGWES